MVSISFEKYSLPNGLDVVLHEDHSLPMAAVNIWYHVGSKDEEVGRTGFAHLFEHVMFEGSKNHNESFFNPLQKVGANVNGSTTSDRTNYWVNLPSNYLELALWLESDRMGFLLDALDQKRFDIQRDVVKNERRQSYENRPYGMAHLTIQPVLFPMPHPYSWPVIGSQEDLDAAELDDVKAFFRKYYAPSNASLAIAGDIDPGSVKQLVEKYFGDLPPGPPINRVGRMDSSLNGHASLTIYDRVQLSRLYLTWPTGPAFDPHQASLELLASVLGDGKSSRLHRLLVLEKQIARDVRVFHYGQEIAGEFQIQATVNPGHTLEEVEGVVREEFERIRREPPTENELTRAKNRIENQHVRQLERIGGFGGRADILNFYNTFKGDPALVNTDLDRYMAVTAEDVQRAASTFGKDEVRLNVLPESSRGVTNGSLDRSIMPAESSQPEFTPPVPRRARLSNGMEVVFIEKPGLPMVAFGVMVRAGGITDPVDKPGLSNLLATMLPEGTSNRTSEQIAGEMEFLGAHLSSDASREYVLLSTETLTSHWSNALEIIADVTRNATFPAEEMERVRSERLTDLRRVSDNPVAIATRAAGSLLYGPETTYGHPLTGTESSVEAITRDDLRNHFDRYYGPKNAAFIVVGHVAESEIVSNAERFFGDWSVDVEPITTEQANVDGVPSNPTTIFLADKPGAAQSIIRAGHLTVPRLHPDYHTLNLVNYIFGGQFSARLNMNLRQDKGYSYGYNSSVNWYLGPSPLVAGGGVQTAVTKEAIIETLKEFSEIRGVLPVTEKEFNDARDGMLRGVPSNFETMGQTLHQIVRLVLFGLPDDYFTNYVNNLQSITMQDVHRVAEERIHDDHLSVVVVGDKKVIEPGLKEIGLPIVEVDYEGHRIG